MTHGVDRATPATGQQHFQAAFEHGAGVSIGAEQPEFAAKRVDDRDGRRPRHDLEFFNPKLTRHRDWIDAQCFGRAVEFDENLFLGAAGGERELTKPGIWRESAAMLRIEFEVRPVRRVNREADAYPTGRQPARNEKLRIRVERGPRAEPAFDRLQTLPRQEIAGREAAWPEHLPQPAKRPHQTPED